MPSSSVKFSITILKKKIHVMGRYVTKVNLQAAWQERNLRSMIKVKVHDRVQPRNAFMKSKSVLFPLSRRRARKSEAQIYRSQNQSENSETCIFYICKICTIVGWYRLYHLSIKGPRNCVQLSHVVVLACVSVQGPHTNMIQKLGQMHMKK